MSEIVPKIGDYNTCVAVLESEKRIPNLMKLCKTIDQQMNASSLCTADQLVDLAANYDQPLIALSGYGHLLMAEQMRDRGFDVDSINREIDKAEAMLSLAHLGGNHPWLPRAQKLKRIVNLKSYTKLGISILGLLAVILLAGVVYRYICDHDIDVL